MPESRILTYRVLLTEEPEGGFTASVPSLPGCVSYGETLEEGLTMIREAIEGYIAVLKDSGDPIPDDSATFEYSISIPA